MSHLAHIPTQEASYECHRCIVVWVATMVYCVLEGGIVSSIPEIPVPRVAGWVAKYAFNK